MSSTVRSYGFIGVLAAPFATPEAREAFCEAIWDKETPLDVTYDGALAYIDYNKQAPLREREDIYFLDLGGADPAKTPQDLVAEAAKHGLAVDPASIRPFNCIWYNGSDSPVDMLTKAAFLARTGQAEG